MSLNNMEAKKFITGTPQTKLWNQPYLLTLVEICVASLTMTFFMPLLPIYIKMIGGNISLAGLVVSIYTFVALISRPFFAILIDRYGRKSILLIGLALILVGCFLYSLVALIGLLLVIRVVHGMGYSATTNATGTIAADVIPAARRGQGFGYYGFVMTASLALGPAAALMIFKSSDIKMAFTVATVIAAIGMVVAFFISYERKPGLQPVASNQAPRGKMNLGVGYEKTALPASLVMLFVAFAYSGIVTFLPSYAGTLGIENISLYFIVYAVVLLITRLIVDWITKTRDISIVLLPGILLMGVAFTLLGFGKTLPLFLAAAVFYGIGYGAVQPTLNALVISACAPSKRSAANSTFFSALDLGIGLGAMAWGFVSQALGYPAIFIGCIAFMFLAIIAYLLVLRKSERTG